MQRQNYMITAEEVAESMGISLGYAYKLLRKLNKELADQGYDFSIYIQFIPEFIGFIHLQQNPNNIAESRNLYFIFR